MRVCQSDLCAGGRGEALRIPCCRPRALRVGNGLDENTDVDSLIDRDAFDKVSARVKDALDRGARRVIGHDPARPEHEWGCYDPPTLLTGTTADMLVCREETFGPVISLTGFRTDEEAINLANATQYGHAAYVFTSDATRAGGSFRVCASGTWG